MIIKRLCVCKRNLENVVQTDEQNGQNEYGQYLRFISKLEKWQKKRKKESGIWRATATTKTWNIHIEIAYTALWTTRYLKQKEKSATNSIIQRLYVAFNVNRMRAKKEPNSIIIIIHSVCSFKFSATFTRMEVCMCVCGRWGSAHKNC